MNALEFVLLLAKPLLLIWHFIKYFIQSLDDLEESKRNKEPRANWLSIFLILIIGILFGFVITFLRNVL